jgi:cell division protein FtsA
MSLIKKSAPTPDDLLLALDIGTEFVKALIARQGKTLEVIGIGKSRQDPASMYSGAIADIAGVVKTCEAALAEAEKQAETTAKRVIIGIAGELVKGNTTTIRYRRAKPTDPLTEAEMQEIIDEVQQKTGESARRAVALETNNPDVEVRLINSALVSLHIDGYKVSNPIGFKGKEVAVQIYTAFAPLVHISAIEKVCAELDLELVAVAVEPFAVCRACLGDDVDSNFTAIVMDIGGGTTDVAVVDDGGVEGTKMFGLGGRAFTHQISTSLGLENADAEKLKIHFEDPRLKPELKEKLDAAIARTLDVWLSGVEVALEEFTAVETLPPRILLCGGGAGLPSIPELLAIGDWYKDLAFSRRPVVHLLDPADVVGITNSTDYELDHTFITAMGLLRVGLDTLVGTVSGTGVRAKLARLLRI